MKSQGFHKNINSRRNESPDQNQNPKSRMKKLKLTLNEFFSFNFFFFVWYYMWLRPLQSSSSTRLQFPNPSSASFQLLISFIPFFSQNSNPLFLCFPLLHLLLLLLHHNFTRGKRTKVSNLTGGSNKQN